MKSKTQLIIWSINYYKEQGGQGEPSEEASEITASKVLIRNAEGDLLQEIDRDFVEFKLNKLSSQIQNSSNLPSLMISVNNRSFYIFVVIIGLSLIAFTTFKVLRSHGEKKINEISTRTRNKLLDGSYLAYEEGITVKNGIVVECSGSFFGEGRGIPGSCKGWTFNPKPNNVIVGVNGKNVMPFCKGPAPVVNTLPYYAECTNSGWNKPDKSPDPEPVSVDQAFTKEKRIEVSSGNLPYQCTKYGKEKNWIDPSRLDSMINSGWSIEKKYIIRWKTFSSEMPPTTFRMGQPRTRTALPPMMTCESYKYILRKERNAYHESDCTAISKGPKEGMTMNGMRSPYEIPSGTRVVINEFDPINKSVDINRIGSYKLSDFRSFSDGCKRLGI